MTPLKLRFDFHASMVSERLIINSFDEQTLKTARATKRSLIELEIRGQMAAAYSPSRGSSCHALRGLIVGAGSPRPYLPSQAGISCLSLFSIQFLEPGMNFTIQGCIAA
jgi:hypothetical protein